MEENENLNNNYDNNSNIKNEKNRNPIKRIVNSIIKMINNSQKIVKKSLDILSKQDNLSTDWIDILAMVSNPISLDFLIDGVPKLYYDIFDSDKVLEILIEVPNIEKEEIQIKRHYKTINIYIKNYLVEKIDLSKYLKSPIKHISAKYEDRVVRIQIQKSL